MGMLTHWRIYSRGKADEDMTTHEQNKEENVAKFKELLYTSRQAVINLIMGLM